MSWGDELVIKRPFLLIVSQVHLNLLGLVEVSRTWSRCDLFARFKVDTQAHLRLYRHGAKSLVWASKARSSLSSKYSSYIISAIKYKLVCSTWLGRWHYLLRSYKHLTITFGEIPQAWLICNLNLLQQGNYSSEQSVRQCTSSQLSLIAADSL